MTQMGIAVIGAGVVGRMRARTVAAASDTSLIAVADVDEGRARAAVAGTGARAVMDYHQAIDLPGVEAVIVSSPGHLHEPMVMAALAEGKHVLCEKPLGIDVPSCRRMVEAAARAKRTLAVGFNHRYYPAFKHLKNTIESGAIGAVDHVRAHAGHPGLHEFRAEWMYQQATSGGGAMMDIGIHLTDLVRFAVGDVTDVTGMCSNRIWNVPGSEDNAIVMMKAAGGIPVRYQATWSEWKGYRLSLEVYGGRGMVGAYYAPMMNLTVTSDAPGGRRSRRLNFHPRITLREKFRGWETTATIAFAEELTDFLALIAGKPSRIADGRAGLAAVAVAHAAYESSAKGATVKVGT